MIDIIIMIFLTLVISRVFGELFERIGLPAVVGEIVSGIIIGPALLGLVMPGAEFGVIVNLSLFFIIFTTGLEFSMGSIKKDMRRSFIISFMGNGVSFLMGVVVALAFDFTFKEALFIGCVFSLTALPVALRILKDLGVQNTRFGHLVISASILDDIFSIMLLSLIVPLAISESHDTMNIAATVIRMTLFLLIVFLINRFFKWRHELPSHYVMHYIRKLRTREAEFTTILLAGLGMAFLGELLGVTFIIGAFCAGVIICDRLVGQRVFGKTESVLNTVSFGFFGPIFFAYIGMNFIERVFWFESSAATITAFLIMAVMFILLAFIGKVGGAYIGARLANLKSKTSASIGLAMNARGLMGLVIAGYGYEMGIIDKPTLSLLIVMSIATTLMTPLILQRILKSDSSIQNLQEKQET